MGRVRRLILAVLIVFVGFCIYRGVTPAKWKSVYSPTATVAANTPVAFTCGAPWGTNTAKPPANLVSNTPIMGTPCGSHTSDGIMLGISVVLGAGGIAGVVAWPRRRDDDEVEAEEPSLGLA